MGLPFRRSASRKNEEWLDWLADEPTPASIRDRMRTKAVERANQPVVRRPGISNSTPTGVSSVKTSNPTKTRVSAYLSSPKFRPLITRVNNLYPSMVRNKWAIGIAAVLLVAGGTMGAVTLNKRNQNNGTENPTVLSQATEKPDFAYSLPKGREEELSGQVRFDSNKQVVNYQDSIGGVGITVSQQKLPAGFEEDTANKVKRLAEDFAAKEPITTATPTAYLGTSGKGPQTVIFAKNGLLVFIKSEKNIDNHDWAEYITNLK